MVSPKFYGKPDRVNHNIVYEKPGLLEAYLKGFKPDTRLEIVIKKYVPKRTNRQNRYYFGCVVRTICEETGSDPDTVHAELKKMFLLIKGGLIPIVGSTRKLNTKDFGVYLDKVILWSAEFLGIIIPPPDYIDF